MKPVVAVTGGNGLVGSKFVADFSEQYDFVSLDLNDPKEPVDITNQLQVLAALTPRPPKAIVHFAAYTDVTGAWKQSGDVNGIAYKVNVTGTEVMAKAAKELGAHFIHISTAYVFDGNKAEPYTEEDAARPIEWYGQTKLLAEEVVQKNAADWTILRIDQPFRPDVFPKADIVHRILQGLSAGTLYPQFADHFFGPTYIPDFAKVIDWAIRTKTTGLFHATSGESWTDYAFAQAVAKKAGLDPNVVKSGSLQEYLKTSERPYQKNTALSIAKLAPLLDFKMESVTSSFRLLQVPETVSAAVKLQ